MGDGDQTTSGEVSTHAQKPEKVLIKVGTARGLHGLKGSHLTSTVRVEYGSDVIGESGKIDADTNQSTTEYNYSCNISITVNEPFSLDEIAQTPLVLTFTEILPKDKKAREEKSHVLGQACVDLLQLLKGETHFTSVQSIFATMATPAAIAPADSSGGISHPMGEVDVEISTSNPVISQDMLSTSNMMTICLESMYAVPDTWATNGAQYFYSGGLSVPLNEMKDTLALLPNGVFKAPGEKEGSNQKKWAAAPTASGACTYMPNTSITKQPHEYEDGELKSKEDLPFRMESESDKAHVTWNAERRCFINAGAAESFQYKIAQYRVWPVEVARTSVSSVAKGKGKTDEESNMSYHGVAYVDFSPLLYPGVQKIRGAYPIVPFFENELYNKTNRKPVLTEETSKLIGGIARNISSSVGLVKQAPTKLGKADAKQKPSAAVLKPPDMASEVESVETKNSEAQQYLEHRTYIVLEIALEKPLVAKRQPEALAQRVTEIIPPRAKFPKKIGGAKKAIDDFQAQVARTATLLLTEFRAMFGEQFGNTPGSSDEERRKQFLYELNSSGKYFAFKEQIKYYIVKLVREKFMNTTGFESQEKMQAFIGELYQFLVDQMHMGLNKYLDSEEAVEIPPPVTDMVMLKHFAKEAEAEFEFDVAAKYYQERIARNKNDADNWIDYGIFCLLIEDISKAEECTREAVSIDQKHVVGLMLNGCITMMQDELEMAEVLFEAATAAEPDNVIAWTMLGLYYAGIDNSIMSERAFNEAERLNGIKSGDSFYKRKSYVQLDKVPQESDKLSNIDERPESQDLEDSPSAVVASGTVEPKPMEPNAQSQLDVSNLAAGEITPREKGTNQLGEVSGDQGDNEQKTPQSSIYLQAAEFLLDCHILQMAERSLALELLVSCGQHSAAYHELLSRFKMEQKSYQEAKDAIQKALAIKHENSDAWATLAHIHFLCGEYQRARECFERTLSYVKEPSHIHMIFLRLARIYWMDGEYLLSKQTYLRACMKNPSCITWLGVGKAAYKLNDLIEAEHALKEANVLDNKNAEVWAYLTLVCLKSSRHLEAEQAYKYALKAGLSNDGLIEEIHQTMKEVQFDTTVL